MFVHAILLTDDSDEVVARIKKHYPKCFEVNEGCYLVRCDDLTQDVAIAVGIKGDDRAEDAGGVVVKLNGAYSGFASRSLWEWLDIGEITT